jgi:hypothetical protein
MTSRHDLIKAGAIAIAAGAVPSSVAFADLGPEQHRRATGAFWPGGARISGDGEPEARPASRAISLLLPSAAQRSIDEDE